MGMAYPQYELSDKVINTILNLIEQVKKDNFPNEKLEKITHRPLRPEEINTALTVDTRVYNSTAVGKSYTRILGATNDFEVKTGSVYLFLGWIVINDVSNPFGLDAVVRLLVEGVVRNEACLALINQMENNALLTLDQIVVAGEQTTLRIEVKDPTTGNGNGVVFPLAYRIGPKAQLDVS